MTKYWIFDREDTPQGLPVARLLAEVKVAIDSDDGQLLLLRSEGYGPTVCQWDELLDTSDEIPVSLKDLERVSTGTEEWFYNLDAVWVTPNGNVRFGLHDSTALFIEAPVGLAQQIVRSFAEVRSG